MKDDEGCTGRDTLAVLQSATKLEGRLLVSTDIIQMDTVMVFETSWPVPDSVKFDLPGSRLISYGSYYREVVYRDTGTFKVGLTAYLNDCWDSLCHMIKVSARETSATKSFRFSAFGQIRVWPNPNNGHFSVDMTMNDKSTVLVKLADLATGVIIDERQLRGSDRYTVNYSLNLVPGAYLLYFQSGNEAKTKKIIVI